MTPSKAELRTFARAQRAAMSVETCERASARIRTWIESLPVFERAKVVAIYHPLNREVDVRGLGGSQKLLVYPRLLDKTAKTMEFATLRHHFVHGVFGLQEPDGEPVSKDAIDLIVVPGLVFDEMGGRIGYGAGYYDLYLKDFRGAVVGAAYDQQIAPAIPCDPWDVSMQWIVTETRIRDVRTSSNSLGGTKI
jgi:5-formyltetrahydrofolate cyclo-ligase